MIKQQLFYIFNWFKPRTVTNTKHCVFDMAYAYKNKPNVAYQGRYWPM